MLGIRPGLPDRKEVQDGSSTARASPDGFRLFPGACADFRAHLLRGGSTPSGVLAARVVCVREVWSLRGCRSYRPRPIPFCDSAGPFAAAFPNGESVVWNGGRTGAPPRAWRACRDSRSVLPPCSRLAIYALLGSRLRWFDRRNEHRGSLPSSNPIHINVLTYDGAPRREKGP